MGLIQKSKGFLFHKSYSKRWGHNGQPPSSSLSIHLRFITYALKDLVYALPFSYKPPKNPFFGDRGFVSFNCIIYSSGFSNLDLRPLNWKNHNWEPNINLLFFFLLVSENANENHCHMLLFFFQQRSFFKKI